jgi:predicted SnoaL-like aldol condensation-catalyzing enzyme
MSLESNKQLVRDFFLRAVNGNDPALAETLIHPEFVDHHPIPGQPQGPKTGPFIVEHLVGMSNGKPQVEIRHVFAEGDMVAAYWTNTTPKGALEVLVHLRIKDGKIAERWAALRRPGAPG